jgi:hypothetical protein
LKDDTTLLHVLRDRIDGPRHSLYQSTVIQRPLTTYLTSGKIYIVLSSPVFIRYDTRIARCRHLAKKTCGRLERMRLWRSISGR